MLDETHAQGLRIAPCVRWGDGPRAQQGFCTHCTNTHLVIDRSSNVSAKIAQDANLTGKPPKAGTI